MTKCDSCGRTIPDNDPRKVSLRHGTQCADCAVMTKTELRDIRRENLQWLWSEYRGTFRMPPSPDNDGYQQAVERKLIEFLRGHDPEEVL